MTIVCAECETYFCDFCPQDAAPIKKHSLGSVRMAASNVNAHGKTVHICDDCILIVSEILKDFREKNRLITEAV